jgi:endothelin-converting enzyme/putative endopeptidase
VKNQKQMHAEKILALEIAMSKPRFDRVERRDRRKSYNPMTVADLQKLTPSVDWKNYFTKVGYTNVILVSQPKYMTYLETMLKENKVDDWKAYMRWSH